MLDERFWSKVLVANTNECWEWQANKNNKGYGLFRPGGLAEKRLAHRLSFEAAYGEIPRGLVIRHDCDNPACVNPAHLRAGTFRDNGRDSSRRGRAGQQKLSDAQVILLRRDYIGGMSHKDMAAKYGVSHKTIPDFISPEYRPDLLVFPGVTREDLLGAKRSKTSAILMASDIQAIRARLASGENPSSIGADYGVHKATIYDIKNGRTWRDS